MRGFLEVVVRHSDRLVVGAIAKSSDGTRGVGGRAGVSSDDDDRRRIEVIEHSSQRTRPRAGRDGDVPDDRKLVILGQLWDFRFGDSNLPGAPGVSLDQILDGRRQLARDYHAYPFAQLPKQPFERGDGFRSIVENIIDPGQDHDPNRIELELGCADETAKLGCTAGDSQNGPALEDPSGARGAGDRYDFDSGRAGEPENRLRDGQRSLGISSYDYHLGSARGWIDASEGRSQKFRNRLSRMRKRVDQILAALDLSGRTLANFLQFRNPNPLFCNVA